VSQQKLEFWELSLSSPRLRHGSTMGTMSHRDRRQFLQSSLGAAAGLAAAPLFTNDAGAPPTHPNVLIVQTDQQSAWTLGAYGGTLVKTPHVDSLAASGVTFDHYLTNSGVCTPSRGCLMSGLYPHVNGSIKNNLPMKADAATFATVMRDAGYRTGYAGKWHLNGTPKPGWMSKERSFGFDDCRYMYNRGHWKTIVDREGDNPRTPPYGQIGDATTYTTDWLAQKSIDFLQMGKEDARPFLWMVAIPDPHPPLTVRAPYAGRHQPGDMTVPVSLFERNRPAWAKGGPVAKAGRNRDKKGVEQWLRVRKAKYCDMIPCIDDAVGRILAALEKTGRARDTIVVFTTDHGEYMGEHGLMNKNRIYDTAYRIPLVMRWPAGLAAGARMKHLVASIDVMPTLLGLCGLKVPTAVQGRDASALLKHGQAVWVDEVQQHHSSLRRGGIFTDRWQLCLVEEGDHVLFDRVEDPDQLRNLYADDGKKQVVRELTERIVDHHAAVASPATEWLAAFKTGSGR